VVVGHSMGGFLAQKLMARRRLPGVVLLASVPPTGVLPLLVKLTLIDPLGVLRANALVRLDPVVSTRERVRRLLFSPSAPRSDVDFVAARIGNEAFLAYLDMLFRDLCKPATGTPVLVMGAENDFLFSPESTRRIAAAYGTEAILFPNMAHDMMLEPGWESVADRIVDWVLGGCRPLAPTVA
jgi:pimeloyl-ACP methyl ester carboxylesterase